MIWFYRIFFLPSLLLALPYYLRRMFKRGGYQQGFSHRFGQFPKLPQKSPSKHRIWIQAVSVGEIQAIAPLIQALTVDFPTEIVLTTTTPTAYKIALEKYAEKVLAIGIFPLDFLPFSHATWNRIQPDLALLMESELWPEHLHQAKKRNVPLALINARLSNKSFSRYSKFKSLSRHLLKHFSLILTSTPQDHQRYLDLGAYPDSTFSAGNIKFDVTPKKLLSQGEKHALRQSLGFCSDSTTPPLILLGSSTWTGEEPIILETFKKALELQIDCRLLLVPRHAERGQELTDLLNQYPYRWHRRSTGHQAPQDCLVHLADTTGELATLSQVADLVFIGKSLAPNDGGQTPIEPAALGLPIVYGPNMTNFHNACRALESENAAIRCENAEEVESTLLHLLQNPDKRQSLGAAAKSWHAQNQGATQKTVDHLFKLLNSKSNPTTTYASTS